MTRRVSMQSKLQSIQRTFIISIALLATLSVVALGLVLYATNAIQLNRSVSSQQLHSLTKNYPAVESYLETQKRAEPHFITIANLVKTDQRALIGRALLYTGIPILLSSAFIAYLLARRLVKPVEQTFAAQERFLQDASHEMRNPLAALYAVTQQARESASIKEKNEALDTLERQAKQLVKLNEDLLTLERVKTGSTKAKRQNISDLLLDVTDSVYAQASERNIKIDTNVGPSIHMTIADNDWVCIVRNILENAIKYSHDDSTVHVMLQATKQEIVLRVKDRGIGIPKSQLSHIGERFYRGSNVGRRTGTGLGVAIVQQIVERYRGDMDIQSSPKKGTTVTVRIPTKEEKA